MNPAFHSLVNSEKFQCNPTSLRTVIDPLWLANRLAYHAEKEDKTAKPPPSKNAERAVKSLPAPPISSSLTMKPIPVRLTVTPETDTTKLSFTESVCRAYSLAPYEDAVTHERILTSSVDVLSHFRVGIDLVDMLALLGVRAPAIPKGTLAVYRQADVSRRTNAPMGQAPAPSKDEDEEERRAAFLRGRPSMVLDSPDKEVKRPNPKQKKRLKKQEEDDESSEDATSYSESEIQDMTKCPTPTVSRPTTKPSRKKLLKSDNIVDKKRKQPSAATVHKKKRGRGDNIKEDEEWVEVTRAKQEEWRDTVLLGDFITVHFAKRRTKEPWKDMVTMRGFVVRPAMRNATIEEDKLAYVHYENDDTTCRPFPPDPTLFAVYALEYEEDDSFNQIPSGKLTALPEALACCKCGLHQPLHGALRAAGFTYRLQGDFLHALNPKIQEGLTHKVKTIIYALSKRLKEHPSVLYETPQKILDILDCMEVTCQKCSKMKVKKESL